MLIRVDSARAAVENIDRHIYDSHQKQDYNSESGCKVHFRKRVGLELFEDTLQFRIGGKPLQLYDLGPQNGSAVLIVVVKAIRQAQMVFRTQHGAYITGRLA